MANAGLMELPHIIKNLNGMRADAEKAQKHAIHLQSELNKQSMPKLFVEGRHDVSILKDAISQTHDVGAISFHELGGTPKGVSGFLSKMITDGGVNAETKSLILFDNDPAGRSSFRNLTDQKGPNYGNPVRVFGNIYASCLPSNEDSFNKFLKASDLAKQDGIFESEFLLNPFKSAELLNELLENDAEERQSIHTDYFKKPQKCVLKIQGFKEGTPNWFYARTVPDRLKAEFWKNSEKGIEHNPALKKLCEMIVTTILH